MPSKSRVPSSTLSIGVVEDKDCDKKKADKAPSDAEDKDCDKSKRGRGMTKKLTEKTMGEMKKDDNCRQLLTIFDNRRQSITIADNQ